MSAEVETVLNDLIMKAERTAAEFRMEVANARRVEEALTRLRQLNAAAYNEALGLLQAHPGQLLPIDARVNALPHLPTWN
jgi:hypothetical protein